MSDREPDRRTNDSLQGGEGNPEYGADPRDFGEGGQTVIDPGSREKRDIDRDPTTPPDLRPGQRIEKDEK
jgi:hypothetical protein